MFLSIPADSKQNMTFNRHDPQSNSEVCHAYQRISRKRHAIFTEKSLKQLSNVSLKYCLWVDKSWSEYRLYSKMQCRRLRCCWMNWYYSLSDALEQMDWRNPFCNVVCVSLCMCVPVFCVCTRMGACFSNLVADLRWRETYPLSRVLAFQVIGNQYSLCGVCVMVMWKQRQGGATASAPVE